MTTIVDMEVPSTWRDANNVLGTSFSPSVSTFPAWRKSELSERVVHRDCGNIWRSQGNTDIFTETPGSSATLRINCLKSQQRARFPRTYHFVGTSLCSSQANAGGSRKLVSDAVEAYRYLKIYKNTKLFGFGFLNPYEFLWARVKLF